MINIYRKIFVYALVICISFQLCSCGSQALGSVKASEILISQDYSLAFRDNDPIIYYVVAAIKVLSAQGRVEELSSKWFGDSRYIEFEKDAYALDNLAVPKDKVFIIGVDVNSFPFVYISNDQYWGFDIELAIAVSELLGWTLQEHSIEKENVYNELASGDIDCAWGGIALNEKEVQNHEYVQYGPYIHNDIVIATKEGTILGNLKGKTLCMPSTTEALEALNTKKRIAGNLGNVVRLVGGTMECFNYLYAGKCDAILTDSTALQYYNCH